MAVGGAGGTGGPRGPSGVSFEPVTAAPGGVAAKPNVQITAEFRAAFQNNDIKALAQEVARQCPYLSSSAVGGFVDFVMGTRNGQRVGAGLAEPLSFLQSRIKNQPTVA